MVGDRWTAGSAVMHSDLTAMEAHVDILYKCTFMLGMYPYSIFPSSPREQSSYIFCLPLLMNENINIMLIAPKTMHSTAEKSAIYNFRENNQPLFR